MENRSRHTSGADHTTAVLTKAHFSSLDASKWSPRLSSDQLSKHNVTVGLSKAVTGVSDSSMIEAPAVYSL